LENTMAQTLSFPTRRTGAWRAVRSAFMAGLILAVLPAPDPLDANASVPAVRYAPLLPAHRLRGDDKPVSWRDANDTVARIGGWRVYTREAQQPAPLPAAPTGPRP
jgi:hypothetical protein